MEKLDNNNQDVKQEDVKGEEVVDNKPSAEDLAELVTNLQNQVNTLQSSFDRKNTELQKTKKEYDEFKSSKLTAEERLLKELQAEKDLMKEERLTAQRERESREKLEKMVNLGIDPKFSPFLNKDNVEDFHSAVNEMVQKKIDDALKGKLKDSSVKPNDTKNPKSSLTQEDLKNMSVEEIKARMDEVRKLNM